MKKSTKRQVVEEVEDESWHCDKCSALLGTHFDSANRERLCVIVDYGENLAHSGPTPLIDDRLDLCTKCVKEATRLGEDHRRGLLSHKEETARYLERVAELIRSTDNEGKKA